ncbi:MAG TPA: hypothetical protein VE956_16055 [Nodularia sp. (in: cyanobacteria)]|nr:hypothetical protein [Nodularia sp. (in: cyanobacteria)]
MSGSEDRQMKVKNEKNQISGACFYLDFYFPHFLNFAAEISNLNLLSSKFDGK